MSPGALGMGLTAWVGPRRACFQQVTPPIFSVQGPCRSSKLLYQNIGPFQVLEAIDRSSAGTSNEPALTYRLRHVPTGKFSTYSVRHMFPFMRSTKHSQVGEALMEEWAPIIDDGDLGLVLRDVSEVREGMYLWMKPRAGQPGYLSLVTAVDARSDLLEVQLLNTSSSGRVGQWQLVWFDDHPDPKKRQPKPVSTEDEYRTPVSCEHPNRCKSPGSKPSPSRTSLRYLWISSRIPRGTFDSRRSSTTNTYWENAPPSRGNPRPTPNETGVAGMSTPRWIPHRWRAWRCPKRQCRRHSTVHAPR
jgi:hypothetical protein